MARFDLIIFVRGAETSLMCDSLMQVTYSCYFLFADVADENVDIDFDFAR